MNISELKKGTRIITRMAVNTPGSTPIPPFKMEVLADSAEFTKPEPKPGEIEQLKKGFNLPDGIQLFGFPAKLLNPEEVFQGFARAKEQITDEIGLLTDKAGNIFNRLSGTSPENEAVTIEHEIILPDAPKA